MMRSLVCAAARAGQALLLGSVVVAVGCSSKNGTAPQAGPSFHDQVAQWLLEPNPQTRAQGLIAVATEQVTALDTDGAKETLRQAKEAVAQVNDPPARVLVATLLARALGAVGDLDAAKGAVVDAQQAADAIADQQAKANAMLQIAETQQKLDNKPAAAQTLEAVVTIAEQLEDPMAAVLVRCGLAGQFHAAGEAERAETMVALAGDGANKIDSPRRQAEAYAAVGACFQQLGKPDEAEAMFMMAQAKALEVTDDVSRGHALVEIAGRLNSAGRQDQARSLLDEAAAIADKIADQALRSELQTRIAIERAKLK